MTCIVPEPDLKLIYIQCGLRLKKQVVLMFVCVV